MKGPVARSLQWYRKQGWHAFSVSRWIPQARKTIDVAGFGDILAYSPDLRVIVLCQATTVSNQSARLHKIMALDSAHRWVQAGGCIHVHGWAKKGPRGKRKTWQLVVSVPPIDGKKKTPGQE